MRLSRIAMIFQSVSFCTTSLATRYSPHPQWNHKIFFCDIVFSQEAYARIEREKINDRGTIQTLNQELNRLVADTTDLRIVLYYDTDNGGYEYFNFPTQHHNRYVDNDLSMTEHILVIDRQGRPCSMIMKKSVTPFEDRDRSLARISYSLCEVGTEFNPQWRQI
ncbi:putative candidate secreted effector protein [Blumeria hordei DH14]|uniref:Putative candidate secreted effector protein n=1 Tax=Blumeria graminis f. sp. hordei (strain DH14) TaxID=546991 RepID=N1JDG8_BLUG1|nr:putative candidate secreted effector protein [Blumeria hordei DH14]